MQFKKNRAILSAVVAAAMASSALLSVTASAERSKPEKYGTETYAARFLSLYDDVITNGQTNGYLSQNAPSGGFGVPYHSVEELICEAPDYGHETTSEAMSYIVWIAAMSDNLTAKKEVQNDLGVTPSKDLDKAWKTLEMMIPSKSQQNGMWTAELSSQACNEYPEGPEYYPSEGNTSNVGKNPIHQEFKTAYSSEGREYLLHWLADVDDWYGFSGSAEGAKGDFTFINTFQRGDQESCFETIPHPCIEDLKYGNPQQGMKFAFQESTAASWSYTNAPDAEDRAIQAVYAANRWGVGSADVSNKAGMMGDFCRNDMFDKYYKKIGCQSMQANADGGGMEGQHFLMSWYTSWGGAADGMWAWQIGCSHSHTFYQNPLAAYALAYDDGVSGGIKTANGKKDYITSLERQMELYLWLQSAEGPFAGGCTNSWNGKYETYPTTAAMFHDMAYIENPVYADPGSNLWTGNQFWETQRLAELYYIVATEGDASGVKPGGLSLEKALETLLDKWVNFFVTETELTDDGDFWIPSNLAWSGKPQNWTGTYSESVGAGLHATVTGRGRTDLGCATSLADTLIYYAKGKGVEASGVVEDSSDLPQKALYYAQQILDRAWELGRDDIGLSRVDHNGSLARVWEQDVYVPAGKSGQYPYGYTVQSGAKFIDIRPMYKDLPNYDELYAAYQKDKANGANMKVAEAVFDDTGLHTSTDCSEFEEVGKVDLTYHRFWHIGDVLMALGTMYELYPDVIPSTEEGVDPPPQKDVDWGNVDCSEGETPRQRVDVSDAVLLAKYLAGDASASVSNQGLLNADVNASGAPDTGDVTKIINYIAKVIDYDQLGKA